ncbi:MAG: hypothetical protein WCG98_08870 [bacterium]
MKKVLVIMALVAFCLSVSGQTSIPFAYTGASVEWSTIDSTAKVELLAFASSGAYASKVTLLADSIVSTTLVHNVPSRSGHLEDQVWLVVLAKGTATNYLFALGNLPKIEEDKLLTGLLHISALRGDSEGVE